MLRQLAAFALLASTLFHAPPLLACGGASSGPPAAIVANAKQVRERCDGSGQWSISARGSGLQRFEGKRVWLSAVERDTSTRVLLESRITNGTFAFSCAKSLHTNYAYPTFAVIIDEDGDGRCSAGDAQSAVQLYGWNDDQDVTVDAALLRPVRTAHTVVGDRKTFDFCALYFPR